MLAVFPPVDSVQGLAASLDGLSLPAVLEMINSATQSGFARIETVVEGYGLRLDLEFCEGEITQACLYDWHGLDALMSFPQDVSVGRIEFWQCQTQLRPPLMPFANLMGEWARVSDEWQRIAQSIISPSQRFSGPVEPFNLPEGASARLVVAQTRQPLYEVCNQIAYLVQAGIITPIHDSFEWDVLILPANMDYAAHQRSIVMRLLNGDKTLLQLMQRGVSLETIRQDLLAEIENGYSFDGQGRAVRDWLWELRHKRELMLFP